MRTIVGYKSDVGQVRQGNEDSYLIQEPFFAVADGMGGHVAGDIASQTAIETIAGSTEDGAAHEPSILESLIKAANAAIWEKAQDEPSLHGMGTTCTLVLVDDSRVHIGHVGDSRAYLFRGGDLSQLTEDHTLVARMVKEGRLEPEEAERHPQRSIITRTLGVDPEVQVDTMSVPVQEGDRILICSDGLTSMIDTDEIAQVLATLADPQEAVNRLVDLANDAGGEDNVTAVIIDFHEGSSPSAGASVATGLRTEERRTTPEQVRVDTAPDVKVDDNTRAVDVGAVQPQPVAPSVQPAPVTTAPRAIVVPKRRSAWRPVVSLLLIVAVLAIGGYIFFRYVVVANSYFVGATDAGRVAIYQGLPEDVMGVRFQEEEEVTDVRVDELPVFLQGDVEDGIEADSLGDARQTVANLEQRARDEEFDNRTNDRKEGSKNR